MFLMLEKVITLICEELGYDEDTIHEDTVLGELVSDDAEIEELAQLLEGEFDVEFSGELSLDMTVSDVAEMLE